jgi:hypothetical protein
MWKNTCWVRSRNGLKDDLIQRLEILQSASAQVSKRKKDLIREMKGMINRATVSG